MEWIVYTIATVLHLWLALIVLKIWVLLEDPAVKYGAGRIVIQPVTMVPVIGSIGFWMWMFFG
jgi:hypothetical protein